MPRAKNHLGKNRRPKLINLGKDIKWEQSEAASHAYKLRTQRERLEQQRRNAVLKNFRFPYLPTHNILLVGEANCSFARALVRAFRKRAGLPPVPPKLAAERRAHAAAVAAAEEDEDEDEDGEAMTDSDDADADADAEAEDEDADAAEGDEGDDDGFEGEEEDDEAAMLDEDEDEEDADIDDEDEDEDEEEDEEEAETKEGKAKLSKAEKAAAKAAAASAPATSLSEVTGANCGARLLVTCYDSLETSLRKYPDLPDVLAELHAAGARVVFDVDATALHGVLAASALVPAERFDRIVFNFPHVGSGETDKLKAVAENQGLLIKFLSQTLPLLRKPEAKKDLDSIAEEAAAAAAAALRGVGSGANARSAGAAVGTFDARDPAIVASVMARVAADKDIDLREATLKQNVEKILRARAGRDDRGGEVHISLKTGHPYDQWKPTLLAKTLNEMQGQAQASKEAATGAGAGHLWGRFPRLALLRCVPFLPQCFDGYAHRRTLGFKAGVADNEDILKHDGARTYVFIRAPAGHADPALGLDGAGIEKEKSPAAAKQPKKQKRKNKQFHRRGKNKPSLRGWI